MLSISTAILPNSESRKSWFEIATFWKAANLTTVSTIYLGFFALFGTLYVGAYGIAAAAGQQSPISQDTVNFTIKTLLSCLPYVAGYEALERLLFHFFPQKKKK